MYICHSHFSFVAGQLLQAGLFTQTYVPAGHRVYILDPDSA